MTSPAKYDNHLIPIWPAWWFECQTDSGKKKYNPISAKLQTMRQAKPTWFHWNRKDYQTYGLQTHIIQDTRYCSPSSLFEEKGETRRDAEDFNEHTQIDWSLRARPCKVEYRPSQKTVSSSNHLSEPFALNFRFFFKHQKRGLFQQNCPFVAHQQKKHLQKHRRCLRLEINTKWDPCWALCNDFQTCSWKKTLNFVKKMPKTCQDFVFVREKALVLAFTLLVWIWFESALKDASVQNPCKTLHVLNGV